MEVILEAPARARHPCHRDIIDETSALPRNQPDAPGITRRGQKKYRIQPPGIRPALQFSALFRWKIDTKDAIDACSTSLPGKPLEPIAEKGVVIAKKDQGNLRVAAKLAYHP